MVDFRFTQPQRKAIAEVCLGLGLDLAEFAWEEQRNDYGDRWDHLSHPPTGAYFAKQPGSRKTHGVVGTHYHYWPKPENLRIQIADWPSTLAGIREWLRLVKAEIETPDLWALARGQREWLSERPSPRSNSAFNPAEKEQIVRHLKTIEEFTIKSHQLQAEQASFVRDQLKYLAEAADRVGRFDWKNLAASTFVNIVTTVGLDPDKTTAILHLATQLLGPLVLGVKQLLGT